MILSESGPGRDVDGLHQGLERRTSGRDRDDTRVSAICASVEIAVEIPNGEIPQARPAGRRRRYCIQPRLRDGNGEVRRINDTCIPTLRTRGAVADVTKLSRASNRT